MGGAICARDRPRDPFGVSSHRQPRIGLDQRSLHHRPTGRCPVLRIPLETDEFVDHRLSIDAEFGEDRDVHTLWLDEQRQKDMRGANRASAGHRCLRLGVLKDPPSPGRHRKRAALSPIVPRSDHPFQFSPSQVELDQLCPSPFASSSASSTTRRARPVYRSSMPRASQCGLGDPRDRWSPSAGTR